MLLGKMSTASSSKPQSSPADSSQSPFGSVSGTITQPLQVPSVEELSRHLSGEQLHPMLPPPYRPKPPIPVSLVQGMIGGNSDILVDDCARNPGRYSPHAQELLSELAAGRSPDTLTPEEQRLLDLAVLDFAAAPKPVPSPAMQSRPKPRPVKVREEESIERGRPWEDAAPGVEPELYWWLK